MKNVFWLIMLASLFFTGCGKKKDLNTFTTPSDLKGTVIASQRGALFAEIIDEIIPGVKHQLFDSLAEVVDAVLQGSADAACLDMPVAQYIVAKNPELVILPYTLMYDKYGFAVAKSSELGIKANETLQGIIGRGTIRRLRKDWLSQNGAEKDLPVLNNQNGEFDGSFGTFKYGFATGMSPISFLNSNGNPAGLELDIVNRIAHRLNMTVEFIPMLFEELLPKLSAGEIDMAGGNMSITSERLKTFDFVGPYMDGGIVFVIKRVRAGK
jgi:ABC-type amino acid transport substrate-binding protein